MKLKTDYGLVIIDDNTEEFEVTRFYFPHGDETEPMECTTHYYSSFEKALAYCKRYSSGVRFASVEIRDNTRKVIFEISNSGGNVFVNGSEIDETEKTEAAENTEENEKKTRSDLIENNREKIYDTMKMYYKEVLRNNFEFQYGLYIGLDGEISILEDSAMDEESNYLAGPEMFYITTIFENRFDVFYYCDDPEDKEEQEATIDFWAGEKDFDLIIDYAIFND